MCPIENLNASKPLDSYSTANVNRFSLGIEDESNRAKVPSGNYNSNL